MLLRRGEQAIDAYLATGTAPSVAAGRISYTLGLQGPSIAIDTACSASLVAVHLACQSLRSRECRMALAGGVNLILSPEVNIALSKAHMMASDGRCKTFDSRADGFVRGEGCGIVVLKRLSDATAEGGNILAVIRGSAVNQDGRSSGITAPNGKAQQEVIRQALAAAGVSGEQIDYVEAHGTGTALGDPIEAHALAAVLGPGRSQDNALVVGSVKTNIGHLESAAGVAGLIKVVLSLQRERIPSHLHFHRMNPHIDWGGVPVEIPTQGRAWPRREKPRLAGVSSFGFSGTNAHVIVEEAPRLPVRAAQVDRPLHIFILSARSARALQELVGRLDDALASNQAPLADVCFTANSGRAQFEWRAAFVAATIEELRKKLSENSSKTEVTDTDGVRPAFLFSGQGSQYPGMGRQLYDTQPVFRKALDRCAELLQPELPEPLLEVLWGKSTELLDQTAYTQPALFAFEYSLSELWKSWGVEPGVVLGHSVGEYVAACVAGVYSLEDGLRLIAARARLMQAVAGHGAMTAAIASEHQVTAALQGLESRVSLAAVNAPESVVISGYADEVSIVEERLRSSGIRVQRLAVSHAFHSPQMDEMADAFERVAASIQYHTPRVRLLSSVTGKTLTEPDLHARYWRQQVRQPVRFAAALQTLAEQGCKVFLEIGPGTTLTGLGRQCLPGDDRLWAVSLKKGRGDWEQLLDSVARLYERGAEIDWQGFDQPYQRQRVVLPTYPFQRQRYWIETEVRRPAQTSTELAAQIENVERIGPAPISHLSDDWFYKLDWESTPLRSARSLSDETPSASLLARSLERRAAELKIEHGFDRYDSLRLELNTLCTAYIVQAIHRCGCGFSSTDTMTTDQLAERCAISAKHRMLFGSLLEALREDGILAYERNAWRVLRVPAEARPDLDIPALRKRYPDFDGELEMTGRCANSLAEVLQGKVDPLDLLFPGGSAETAEKIYTKSPGPRVFNQLASEAVAAEVRSRKDGTFRVLEIGAGTGGTTECVLRVLPAERTEYVFTDVSPLFLARASDKFAQYPFFRYQHLDMEQDPATQGLEGEKFDLILAANVLHATADLRKTFRHARKLLAPDGLLVLVEGTFSERWVDLTFGLTEGWWRFTDRDLRTSGPLIPRQAWLDLLSEEGFLDPVAIQTPGKSQQVVLMARMPASKAVDTRWLIVGESSGVAEALVARVREEGGTAVLVPESAPLDAVLETQDLKHVVYLQDSPSARWTQGTPQEIADNSGAGAATALAILHALLRPACTGRLWLITSGAQPVHTGEASGIAITQSPVWGLGRSISLEHPAIWGGLVDLDPSAGAEENAAQCLAAILQSDGEDQCALRKSQRYVPRIVRGERPLAHRLDIKSDGIYLVTGGLGELGLQVARWLADRGARDIILASRTGLPDRSAWNSLPADESTARKIAVVGELEKRGVTVRTPRVDIADPDQVEELFATFPAKKLRGVIHAAAELGSALLKDMTASELASVLRPKTVGTWLLHQHTIYLPLDFFVLFSSTTSLLGSQKLGHYAAANQFLDSFAHYRRELGLPVLTVNWGTWEVMGGTSEAARREVSRTGLLPMSSKDALAALEEALSAKIPQIMVAAIDWSVLRAVYESRRKRSILEHLSNTVVAPAAISEATHNPMDALAHLPEAQRKEALIGIVQEEAAKVLRLTTAEIDVKQGLFDLGMDSLMSVELRSRLEKRFAQTLPTTLTFNYPSVRALAGYFDDQLQKILGAPIKPVPVVAGSSGDSTEDDLAAQLAEALEGMESFDR